MKELRSVEEIGNNLKVILRIDSDLPVEEGQISDNSRLKKSIPTIRLLLERENKIVIVGHRGRPKGVDDNLSLKLVYLELMSLLEANGENLINNVFVDDIKSEEKIEEAIRNNQIIFVENLRFWPEEEEGKKELFLTLSKYCNAFVNDAFAVAHRESASVLLHREMETFYGLDFVEEVERMENLVNPSRPLSIVLGGGKEDKLNYLEDLKRVADYILIGGKLPLVAEEKGMNIDDDGKVFWAKLKENKLDLSDEDVNKFIEKINVSKTVIWSGAMGLFESEENRDGTEKIAMAVAKSGAEYKVVAGGDTNASIRNLGLSGEINFRCAGAGVLLEFLSKGSLAAWS